MDEFKVGMPEVNQKNSGVKPGYDNPNKPKCMTCESRTWVVALGRDDNWSWSCTNCARDVKGNDFQ